MDLRLHDTEPTSVERAALDGVRRLHECFANGLGARESELFRPLWPNSSSNLQKDFPL